MRVAGLDLGTNTFLCLIADVEFEDDKAAGRRIKSLSVVRDEVRVVRLGQGVHATRELHAEALARAEETFREFSQFILEAKCDRVLAVATSAARDVKNADRFLELGRRYGIPIEIISGEKEAELTFAGAMEPSWSGITALIDVGGGSTEIILGEMAAGQPNILARISADVGSVRMTELYVTRHPIDDTEVEALRQHVRRSFAAARLKLESTLRQNSKADSNFKIERIIGVAGTPTTLATVDLGHAFETDKVHGHMFSLSKLEEWTHRLAKMSIEQRQRLAGMEPKRADVIVAGAICVIEAFKVAFSFGAESQALRVSVRGLRYGVVKWAAL